MWFRVDFFLVFGFFFFLLKLLFLPKSESKISWITSHLRLQRVPVWGMFGDSSFTLVLYPQPAIPAYLRGEKNRKKERKRKKKKTKIPAFCCGIVLLII